MLHGAASTEKWYFSARAAVARSDPLSNPDGVRRCGHRLRAGRLWASAARPDRPDRRRHPAPGLLVLLRELESDAGDRDVHDYAPATGDPYDRAVRRVDTAIGKLLRYLDEADLREGTQFVLTADHGERFFETHPIEGRPKHEGSPSFEYLLRVPLIVAPAAVDDPDRVFRTQDIPSLIARIGGRSLAPRSPLAPDELFLGELQWHTYRKGRWKSFREREGERFVLVDLERDAEESRDVAAEHPEVAAEHRRRMDELTRELAADAETVTFYSAEDLRRLRALGYVDE